MQLVNPIWLWGLTGLIIPVAIHLLSRRQGKVIKFGSLRHLEESISKQSINIRLNEILLLILRASLIFLVVIFLCGINTDLFRTEANNWIIVEDGLGNDLEVRTLVDSLKNHGFEVKNMMKEFPDSDERTKPFANYWEMVQEVPAGSLEKVIIISRSYSSGFKGRRVALPNNVTWIYREPAQKDFTLSAVKFSNDSVVVRKGRSSSVMTSFSNVTERTDQLLEENSVKPSNPDTVRVKIFADLAFDYDRKIIEASLRAIEKTIPLIFRITLSSTEDAEEWDGQDWIIWLSEKNLNATKTNKIVFRKSTVHNSNVLVNVGNSFGQTWVLTKRLSEEVALNEHLTLMLSSLFSNSRAIELSADTLDRTTFPEQFLLSAAGTAAASTTRIVDDMDEQVIAIVILLLLFVERTVAFKRTA